MIENFSKTYTRNSQNYEYNVVYFGSVTHYCDEPFSIRHDYLCEEEQCAYCGGDALAMEKGITLK